MPQFQHVKLPLPSGGTLHMLPVELYRTQGAPALEANDVLVLDDRHVGNPSFQVMESHTVCKISRMREVLDAIIAFDAAAPADPPWKRSRESLLREWRLHNLAYRLHIYRRSARHVDLDNRDEGTGYLHFFIVAFQRVVERVFDRILGKRKKRAAQDAADAQGKKSI